MVSRVTGTMLRLVRFAGTQTGLAVMFVWFFVVALAVHLPLAPSRRAAAFLVTRQLNRAIVGEFSIGNVTELSLGSLRASNVKVMDGQGGVVLAAPELRVSWSLWSLLSSLMPGGRSVEVSASWIRVPHLQVFFLPDPSGAPTIGNTFTPTSKPSAAKPSKPSASTRTVAVSLPNIEIGRVEARGQLGGWKHIHWTGYNVRGAVQVQGSSVHVDVRPSSIRVDEALPDPVNVVVDYHFRSPNRMWTHFVGTYDGLVSSGRVKLTGGYLDILVDLPFTKGNVFKDWLPDGLRILDGVEGRLSARGTLPLLNVTADLRDGFGNVRAIGSFRADSSARTNLSFTGMGLDLHRWLRGAPETAMDVRGGVEMWMGEDGVMHTHTNLASKPFVVSGVLVPPVRADARSDSAGLFGQVHLLEPGATVHADFSALRRKGVRATARVNVPSLKKVLRLQGRVSGQLTAKADVVYRDGKLDVDVSGDASRLSMDSAHVRAVHVLGQVGVDGGKMRAVLGAAGDGLELGPVRWRRWNLAASGPLDQLNVRIGASGSQGPDMQLGGNVRWGKKAVRIQQLRGKMARAGERVGVSAASISLGAGGVSVRHLRLEGAGKAVQGDVVSDRSGVRVKLFSAGLDLRRMSRVLGLNQVQIDGRLGIDVDVKASKRGGTGCAKIDLRHGRIQGFGNVDVSTRMLLAGRRADVQVMSAISSTRRDLPDYARQQKCLTAPTWHGDGIGRAKVRGSLSLAGSPARLDSWQRATGTATLDGLLIDLDKVEVLRSVFAGVGVPLPVRSVGGQVRLRADALRRNEGGPVAWKAELTTKNLHIDGGDAPGAYLGGDVRMSVAVTNEREATLGGCLRSQAPQWAPDVCDPADPNLLATVGGRFSFASWMNTKRLLMRSIMSAPLHARLVVLDRPSSELFRAFRFKPIGWNVERGTATVDLSGTLADPTVVAKVQVLNPSPADRQWMLPTVVCGRGAYKRGRLDARADLLHAFPGVASAPLDKVCAIRRGGDVSGGMSSATSYGAVVGRFQLPRCWLAGTCGIDGWSGDVSVDLDGLELARFPVLEQQQIAGTAGVHFDLQDLGGQPRLDGAVQVDDLVLDSDVRYDRSRLSVEMDGKGLRANVDVGEWLKDHRRLASRLRLSLETTEVRLERGLSLRTDEKKPAHLGLHADKFSIAALSPILQPMFRHVDGKITGMASADWLPSEEGFDVKQLFISLQDGAFQVPMIGQEFLDVSAILQSGRHNQLYLQELRARALSGQVRGSAKVELDGFRVARASAVVSSEKSSKMRLTYQGVPLGDAYGKLLVDFQNRSDRYDMIVALRDAHIDLVDSDLRAIQDLSPNPDIHVVPTMDTMMNRRGIVGGGRVRGAQKPWRIRFKSVGSVVVTRSGMRFALQMSQVPGHVPIMTLQDGEPSKLDGHILISEGRVDVLGKEFVIEQGKALVSFDGDPAHPMLNVTAHWDAPDGSRVFADVTGDVRDPRVRLRSDPARPPAEVLALVMFGVESGQGTTGAGGGDNSQQNTAAQVGGGVAAAGVNVLLSDLSPVNISTRLDSTGGQSVSPTLVVEVAKNISAEATYVPETRLDQTDRYLLTLDWRFLRQWSLRTTLGDQGSSVVDVIWQHRY